MFLIVGLGNPGLEYHYTRHNIGFMAIDAISRQYGASLLLKSKFYANLAKTVINGYNVILSKPDTYMNLSGNSVAAIAAYYKIPLSNIIILHDDIDLAFGVVKYKIGGGHGGHNGIKSVDASMGSTNYHRLRIGVGRPEHGHMNVSDYVLGKFSQDELKQVYQKVDHISKELHLLLGSQLERFKKALSGM